MIFMHYFDNKISKNLWQMFIYKFFYFIPYDNFRFCLPLNYSIAGMRLPYKTKFEIEYNSTNKLQVFYMLVNFTVHVYFHATGKSFISNNYHGPGRKQNVGPFSYLYGVWK